MVHSKRRNIIIAWIASALVVSIGVGVYRYRATSLDAVPPREGPLVESVYGLGTVIAPRTFQAKTAVSLAIRSLPVAEGQEVPAGSPLVRFDEGIVIRAPFAGTVTNIPFKEGELIFPNAPVVTVVKLEELYLEISLEQQSVLRVKRGQEARVTFESLRNERFHGQVTSIYPRENQFIVRIDLEKFPDGVLPGMTADVAIEVARRESALSIPVRAVSGGRVTVLREGHRRKIEVRLGVSDGEWVEILPGELQSGDQIVLGRR
jgi:multidrug efflux pump subunit AcrA (membrane-fusion protein)